ncbi:unnamed protein product [Dicrocoelium dendriticum]|nr:unnamed protein product [Dicrocoelium dendriticum]
MAALFIVIIARILFIRITSSQGLINSSGNVGYLECRKPPVVSVVPDVVLMPQQSTPFTLKLQAILSEPTEDDAVEVLCNPQQNKGAKVLTDALVLPPTTSSATLVVNIVAIGLGNQIKLSCFAQSLNGTQFKATNSVGNNVTLQVVEKTLLISPERTYLHRSDFKLSFIPNGITQDLSVVCQVSEAGSEVDATNLLQNPLCLAPANISQEVTAWKISPSVEVVLPNPAFSDLTPCPCDVTPGRCDLSCCCDQLCPAHQPAPCFSGPFGGDFSNLDKSTCTLSRYGVSSTPRYTVPGFLTSSNAISEWQREFSYRGLRCVSTSNGPVLGYFYPQKSVANIASQINENYATRGRSAPTAGLSEYGLRQLTEGDKGGSSAYVKGYSLRLERNTARLPGPVAHTINSALELATLRVAPVEFLLNQERYQCPIQIDRTLCRLLHATDSTILPGKGPHSIASRLSSTSYLLGDGVVNYRIPNAYRIKSTPLSTANHVPTAVKYFCLTPQEITFYSPGSFVPTTTASNTSGFLSQVCKYDQRTLKITCIPTKRVANVAALPVSPCPWDNGYEIATPAMHGDICQNVVLQVDYRISWVDGQVTGAEADIFLADINISVDGTYYQAFSVHFANAALQEATVDQTSQLIGYQLGSDLITGVRKGSIPGHFEVILEDVDARKSELIIPDTLCGHSEKQPFKFGLNSIVVCQVTLNTSAFLDCATLRSLMTTQLNQLVPTELVAVFVKPSVIDADDWVEVQKEPTVPKVTHNQSANPVGTCNQVPSGIHLDVFYSMQGKINGEPVWLVVGAQVSYIYSNWTLTCDSSGLYSGSRSDSGLPCSDADTQQTLTLTTQVTYTKVPTDWTGRIWNTINAAKLTAQGSSQRTACEHDTCWEEAFYAWSNNNHLFGLRNERTVSYSMIASLGIGAIGLTLMLMIGPFR